MRLDRAFGNVQIPSNFGIVTPLQKQIDDLTFTGSDFAKILFHKHHTFPTPPPHLCDVTGTPKNSLNEALITSWIQSFAYFFACARPNPATEAKLSVEKSISADFYCKIAITKVFFVRFYNVFYTQSTVKCLVQSSQTPPSDGNDLHGSTFFTLLPRKKFRMPCGGAFKPSVVFFRPK
jgi:hypothetical protein